MIDSAYWRWCLFVDNNPSARSKLMDALLKYQCRLSTTPPDFRSEHLMLLVDVPRGFERVFFEDVRPLMMQTCRDTYNPYGGDVDWCFVGGRKHPGRSPDWVSSLEEYLMKKIDPEVVREHARRVASLLPILQQQIDELELEIRACEGASAELARLGTVAEEGDLESLSHQISAFAEKHKGHLGENSDIGRAIAYLTGTECPSDWMSSLPHPLKGE